MFKLSKTDKQSEWSRPGFVLKTGQCLPSQALPTKILVQKKQSRLNHFVIASFHTARPGINSSSACHRLRRYDTSLFFLRLTISLCASPHLSHRFISTPSLTEQPAWAPQSSLPPWNPHITCCSSHWSGVTSSSRKSSGT